MQIEVPYTEKINLKKKKLRPQRLKLTLMAIPFVIFIFAFQYVPLLGWGLSFFNYKPGYPLNNLEFVGLKYYRMILENWDDVSNALINTFVLSGLSLMMMPAPVIFAIMLSEIRSNPLKKLIQTTVTLPHFVSWIIVFSLSFAIFSHDGMLNKLLLSLGFIEKPTNLLGNYSVAWRFMTALSLWKGLGWSSIVYLAAIAGIEKSLYEAASIDGAGRFQSIWHITVPGIMPTFIVLLILNIGNLLSVGFQQYFVFNNPMLAGKLEVIDMYTYRIGIRTQDYSFAVAISVVRSIVSISLISFANLLAKRIRGEAIF